MSSALTSRPCCLLLFMEILRRYSYLSAQLVMGFVWSNSRGRGGGGGGGHSEFSLPRIRKKTFIINHQSLFIHEIVSFYMVFLGIVFKTRLKYSKELLTIMLKIQKLTLWITRVSVGHGVLEKSFPWIEVLKTFKLGSFLISEGILFHRTDPL